jgi:SAM-dependent methyltransferase
MARRSRRTAPGSSFELYAAAMLDHWLGKKVRVEFERDDGYRSLSGIHAYFAPAKAWPRMEREAMKLVRGRVLDLGSGPGRHALYLQSRGHAVVALDGSSTQVALARIRGVQDVYLGDLRRMPKGLGTFDTVLMLGNNLGLPGDLPRMRTFLRSLRGMMRKRGRLIGNSRMPGTWSDDHLPYVKRNLRRGRPPGLLSLRVRYKGRIGDWFDLLLLAPEELARLAEQSGWELTKVFWEGGYSVGDYIAVLQVK